HLGRLTHLASRTAAHADGADRVAIHDPVDHVEVVNVLLDDVIAAQPEEVVPVVDLVRAVLLARLPVVEPDPLAVPGTARRDDVADRPIVNLANGVEVALLVAALGAGDDGDVLLLGLIDEAKDLARASRVHADRLL